MKDLQVVAALRQCRDLYIKEKEEIVSSYESKRKSLERVLAQIEKKDYTDDFLPMYE